MHPVSGLGTHQRNVEGRCDGLVADHTPGSAELEGGEDVLDIDHPGLFGHAPAGGEGREPAPLKGGGELGGSVVTEVGLQEVTLLEVVVHTAEETDGGTPGVVAADGLGTGSQRELRVVDVHEVLLLGPYIGVVVTYDVGTEEEVEHALAELEVVGGSDVPGLAL